MTKNPLINALAATSYITLVASLMFYGSNHPGPDKSVLIPIAMMSLFTLSAAMMGYIFLSQPLQLYLDGKKKDGINLFIKTLAIFAGITSLALFALFSGVLF